MLNNKFPASSRIFAQCRRKIPLVFLQILIFLTAFFLTVYGQKTETVNWELPFKKCWEISTNLILNEKLASDNVTGITIATQNNLLASINPNNGEEIWRTELGGNLGTKPISDGKDIFVYINTGNNILVIRSINPITGITNWQLELNTFEKFDAYLYSHYFFAVSEGGLVFAIDKTNGKQLWSKRFSGKIYSFDSFDTEEIIFSTDGKISELSIKDGTIKQEWMIPSGEILNLLNIKERRIIWGNSSGEIFCFDLINRNMIWKVKTGGNISSLTVTEKGLLATSFDNFAYFFSVKNGRLLWKKRLAGRINVKPLIFLNYAVVVSSGDSIALILDLESGKTVNQISIDSSDFFSGSPGIWKNLIIFQTFKGIWAFSNINCA